MLECLKFRWLYWCCPLVCLFLLGRSAECVELPSTRFDLDQTRVKYGLVSAGNDQFAVLASEEDDETTGSADPVEFKRKSPAKAFFLSLLVPGAGQFYYGSRIKPVVFLGVEAAAWGLHAKYHAEGEDLTDAYEAYNQEHWIPDRYADYMRWTYDSPTGDDEDAEINTSDLSHHLPETRTQQYYEMTGKYDQFAWGWDDAYLPEAGDTLTWTDFSADNPAPRFIERTPESENRDHYETMRDDANAEFDKATRMIMLSLVNRVVSAVEALVMTNRRNKQAQGESTDEGTFLSRLKFKPSLKSMHSKRDTPYLKVTYKF